MTVELRYLNRDEFRDAEKRRRRELTRYSELHGEAWTAGKYKLLLELLPPGSIWECPWYYDPLSSDARERRETALNRPLEEYQAGRPNRFLSIHYWTTWSLERAPYTVVCPNGSQWLMDQVSNNGTGWTVTGDVERGTLTANPSIVVTGYHGWLRENVFSDHLDNPLLPNGILLGQ